MKSYNEEEKKVARNEALAFAIKTLTKNRYSSTIARKSYVSDVKEYLLTHGTPSDKYFASRLADSEVNQWESFYESIVSKKKPRDLKVAYLSGPNPENDLEILVKNGILPENVWAFESDNTLYTQAVISALDSKFPFIKLHKGRIEHYLKLLPFKFDIIYLDFCATITNKTISVVRDIFNYQKLNSLGVLITNFSLPAKLETNIEQRGNLNMLAANYLYPKPFTEKLTGLGGGLVESAEANGIEFDEYLKIAKRNEVTFYSQLITRLLFDIPSLIVPYQRFASNPILVDTFFNNFNQASLPKSFYESIMTFPTDYPLIWGLSNLASQEDSFNKVLKKLNNQLSINPKESFLTDSIELVSYFISQNARGGDHSKKLESIRSNWSSSDQYLFCDLFLFHHLKEVLIGQLTSPYYYNIDFTKRWIYKAKSTEMFMDAITYDECRYIFDWMPTLDMLEEGVNDISRQLSLRFAMDSVSKQRRWYNKEFFAGTAVINQWEKTFAAKELKKRKKIKRII